MICEILRPFDWSPDGFTSRRATPGSAVDIPDHLVPGLTAEGYVRPEQKATPASPENKMAAPVENTMAPPVENKRRARKAG